MEIKSIRQHKNLGDVWFLRTNFWSLPYLAI
ncbi:hypothetical protein Zm00014a_042056 [Zea mays]|uniref:Uncharacterized protein n=1 Tax=Zea mays TaxID=4577 RepID=A0A3L6DNK3_MAIZE|nr:hypothetical protein Zm00014a_042056 [Zea mays]